MVCFSAWWSMWTSMTDPWPATSYFIVYGVVYLPQPHFVEYVALTNPHDELSPSHTPHLSMFFPDSRTSSHPTFCKRDWIVILITYLLFVPQKRSAYLPYICSRCRHLWRACLQNSASRLLPFLCRISYCLANNTICMDLPKKLTFINKSLWLNTGMCGMAMAMTVTTFAIF